MLYGIENRLYPHKGSDFLSAPGNGAEIKQ